MKVQLLLLACFVAVTIARGTQRSCDELKARLSSGLLNLELGPPTDKPLIPTIVLACDLDDDGALTSVEFEKCVQRMTDDQSERSADTHQQRAECFQRFTKEADKDLDKLVSSAELGRWLARLDSGVSLGAGANILTGRRDFYSDFYLCDESKCLTCNFASRCEPDGQCSDGEVCIARMCCIVGNGECRFSDDCISNN